MSKASEKVKYLKDHGATEKEAVILVMREQEREIDRLTLELEDACEMTNFIREVTI